MTYCRAGNLAINSLAYMSELALPRCLPSGSRHLVFSAVLTARAEGKHSENKWRQLLLSSCCTFPDTGVINLLVLRDLKETRQSSKLNLWTKHGDTECYTINLREWQIFCHYQRKSQGRVCFFPFSSSNKPPDLQSFMQVKEDQE